MAYFAREDKRHESPARRQGKHVGGPIDVPAPKEFVTRDQVLEANIAAMNKDTHAGAGGVLRYVKDSEKPQPRTRNANHKNDSDIFGPPKPNPTPRPRIRTGVTDEELQRIWAADEKKQEAQQRFSKAPTLVDKMAADPISPVFHHKPKDAPKAPMRQIHLLSETTEERNRQKYEPAGFAGMGKQCRVQPSSGRSCKPAEEFIPPELRTKPRQQGRRTIFPKDQFSFYDDSRRTYDPSEPPAQSS